MDATQLLNPKLNMQWDYDPEADVLYMSVGEPQPAIGVDIGEGLVLRYDEVQSAIVGLTVIGLKSRLEKTQETIPMATHINQYGKGDNIAGDKIAGDKIAGDKVLGNKTQDSHNITIENASNSQVVIGDNNTATQSNTTLDPVSASLAQDLKALLEDFSQDYNPATERGQAKIKDAVLAEMQQNSTLQQRATNALKAAGEQALIEVLNHPAAKITIKAIKAALEA